MSAPDVAQIVRVIGLLAPLIEDVARWLNGDGPEPAALRTLPQALRSELALERLKRRSRDGE